MNPLLKRLASLRRQVRFQDGWLGICMLIALVLGVGVAVGWLDFYLHIPSLVRAALLVGLLISSGYVFYRYVLRPFSKPCDNLNLALRIEEAYPELNDSLATTVQFLLQPEEEQARLGGSAAMRDKTVQQATEKAAGCDFGRILDRRAALVFGAAAICIVLTAGLVVGMNRQYASIAFWRFVEPFGMHTWTRIAVSRQVPLDLRDDADPEGHWKKIDSSEKDKIAKGQAYVIKVNLDGQMPRKLEAKVEIKGETTKTDRTVPLKVSEDGRSAEFITPIDMTLQYQTFRFRITANDGAFPPREPWHVVKVVQEPKLVAPALVTTFPPKYSELPQPKPMDGPGLVEVYAGSTVVLKAKADRKLEQAWIEYVPQQKDQVIPGAGFALFGADNPLQGVGLAAGGHAVWGKVPAVFDEDGESFTITFMPWFTGKFVLHLRDADRLSTQIATDLNVLTDPVPEVKLVQPTANLRRLADGEVPFKFVVADEHFAIRSVFVEYRKKSAATGALEEPVRTLLYDDAQFSKLLPRLSARLGRAPFARVHPALGAFPMDVPDLRMRKQKLEIDMVWALNRQFKDGDLIVVEVCADDFCDVYPTREPGRSHAIEIRIVSKTTLDDEIRREMLDILQRLKKVVKVEEKSLEAVKETQKAVKSSQEIFDKFVENAEAPQRQVRAEIGSLRTKVREVRELIKQNRLTGSQASRNADMIHGTLDSLAKQELPQIDPKLDQVRNELTKDEKIAPKTHKKLADAAKLQDRVVKALNELIAKLEPPAKLDEIASKLRNVNDRAKELANELEKLNSEKMDHDKNPNNTDKDKEIFKKEQEKRIEQLAKEQEALTNQTEKILQEMKDARKEYEKNDDKPNAERLNEALKKAGQEKEQEKKVEPKKFEPKKVEPKDQPPVNAQMRDVAKQLQKDKEAKENVIQKQKDLTKQIDQVIEAIEGQKDNGIKEQIAERKDVKEKIEDINRKIEKLREDSKKLDKIMDERLKEKEKERLVQEHQKLQEEIEKTRRELARLNEPQTAQKLENAAQNLEKAANAIKNGENPDPQQQNAKKELNEAKKDLKEREQELARELLVKLADQLEGLRDREVASLERTGRLHEMVMKRKSWTGAFLSTIEGNIDTQKGIADETDTFKDKLKEAKVFHTLLEKAKKSMDDAGESMTRRRENGKERRFIEMMDDKRAFDAEEMDSEKEEQGVTVRHQKQAVKRLDNLLDSIKDEIKKIDEDKEKRAANDQKPPDNDGNEPPPGPKPRDGIPNQAELKALRAEQLDVMARTKAFHEKKSDPLTDDQKAELRELTEDQAAIGRLIRELLPPAPPPQPKNEDKKEEKKAG